MAVVAYLRVSTEKQFLENQREEITRFAEKNGKRLSKYIFYSSFSLLTFATKK